MENNNKMEKNSPKCPESSLSAALLVAFISLLLFHIFHTFPCNGHSSESRRGPPNTGKLGTGSVYLRWSERASQRARNKRTAGPDPRGGERPAARAGATRFAAEDSAAWLKPAAPAGPRRRRARGAQRCRSRHEATPCWRLETRRAEVARRCQQGPAFCRAAAPSFPAQHWARRPARQL